METIGRNDACWCGSGKKYKKCHCQFDEKLKELQQEGHIIPSHDMIKTPEQIEKIKESGKINIAVLDYVAEHIKAGVTTQQIDDWVYEQTTSRGAIPAPLNYEGFPKSVCTSVNDQVCHGIPSEDVVLQEGDIINVDVSTILDGYFSDASRMFMIGEVSDRAKRLVRVTEECVELGLAAAKPGNRMCDVDLACRNYIEEKGFGKYFTHRTGHSIGLEDHEFGDVSSVNTDIIQVGQCFSVEPGIYLPDENIGVRIEDLVIITEDGCEVLNDFTKDLIIVPEE